jgi:prepilin-type N-terminal cleavage/methylation domain-containing protein
MRRGNRAGLTLLEVLVAVTLLSFLSVGILFSIRLALNAMQKINHRLISNRRVLSSQRILEQQIAGFLPVAAEYRTEPMGPLAKISFFQGEPQSMRFVSTFSLEEASRGRPHILEFQVIPGEDDRGVRLVVNERLYTGPLSAGALCLGLVPGPQPGGTVPRFRMIEVGAHSFVLADRLAFCRFLYQEQMPGPLRELWVPYWIKPALPSALRIEMGPLGEDPARVQPLTLTAPLRVDRGVLDDYTP